MKEHTRKTIPTTADAESWLNADCFIWKGEIWMVKPDGTVSRVEGVESEHGKPNNIERSEQLADSAPNP